MTKPTTSARRRPLLNVQLLVLRLPYQSLDLRSLSLFRILLGLYILYDIVSRVKHGRLSLLFYTSTSPYSFLHPDDTPHKSPIHVIWFYRGSELVQILFFSLTALLAILYSLGKTAIIVRGRLLRVYLHTPVLLWLNVVAMQCRNMHVHDGSDAFTRHLLLWTCFLPIQQIWSLDCHSHSCYYYSYQSQTKSQCKQKHRQIGYQTCSSNNHSSNLIYQVQNNNIAVWGIKLQIVFMYLGTMLARTTDIYGLSIHNLFSKCQWLPPQLTAVYYSLNASFATRDYWLSQVVRSNLLLTKIMTLSATFIEGLVPIACLLIGMKKQIDTRITCSWYQKCSSILPLLIFKLHFGLLLLMNLPNWQFIGMIASTIWIPSHVWDYWQRKLSIWFPRRFSPPLIPQSIETKQKKDDIIDDIDLIMDHQISTPDCDDTGTSIGTTAHTNKCTVSLHTIFKYFFFIYMIYNFAGEHKLIPKHDDGDIGEFLRFSQHWVMFATPPKSSVHDIFIGKIRSTSSNAGTIESSSSGKNVIESSDNDDLLEVDVWQWMKNGQIVPIDLDRRRNEIWYNMTDVYPSPRLERLFSQWSGRSNIKALKYFLKQLCKVDGSPFESFTFIWQYLIVNEPLSTKEESHQRFIKTQQDRVISVNCM